MNCSRVAHSLTSLLGLDRPPVAMATVTSVPEGIPFFSGVSPSACSFWRIAERGMCATRDTDHMNCPVGAMTMGFTLTPAATDDLKNGVAMMCQVGYLDPKETAHLPILARQGDITLYGPLADFPVDPDVVLLWLQPGQAMILREATGDAEWRADRPGGVFGRPTCSALAVASRERSVALSFGCTGMRTFTEIEPSYMLAALAGAVLEDLEVRLTRASQAHRAMQEFYTGRKAIFRVRPDAPS